MANLQPNDRSTQPTRIGEHADLAVLPRAEVFYAPEP
jgi:hypothetical protein